MKTQLEKEDIQTIAIEVVEMLKPLIINNGKHETDDRLFNVRQLSSYIGMSTQWIYNNKSKLPHMNINNKPLFRKSEIDTWLESFRVKLKNETISFSSIKENESLQTFRKQRQ